MNEAFGNSEQLAQPDAAGGLNEQSGNSGQLQADAMRAEFEAWAASRFYSTIRHARDLDRYMVEEVNCMWRGWQSCAIAARQPVGQEPFAWATHHDEPMLYPTFAEAAAYCDDDEPPIPLYTAPPAPAAVPAPDVLRTIAQLNRMRIVLRNAKAYVENFTCKSALPPIQQKMIGQIDEVIGALAHAWPAAAALDGPLAGKYGPVLRPFVAMMERELHANAGKGDRPGWLSMDSSTALLEIYHHMGKLQQATKNADEPGIVEYAADVANMAMMLVDVCGLLPVDDATHPQPAAACVDLVQFRHPVVAWIYALSAQAKQQERDGHAEAYNRSIILIERGKVLLALIDQQAKPAGEVQP